MPSEIITDVLDTQVTGNTIKVSDNVILDCSTIQNYILLPRGGSLSRGDTIGDFRWNTITERAEVFNGVAWLELALKEEYDDVTKAGLIFYIDAADEFSYTGLGDNVTNLAKTYFVTCYLKNEVLFDTNEKAFLFDATSTYAEISTELVTHPSCLKDNDGITLIIWFKADSTLNFGTDFFQKVLFAMNSSDGGANYFRIGVDPSGNGIYLDNNNGTIGQTYGTTNYNDDNWHQLAFVMEPGSGVRNSSIYVDNVFVASQTDTNPQFSSVGAISIGIDFDSSSLTDVFGGSISIVNIFNRNLSTTELTANFNAFKNRYGL